MCNAEQHEALSKRLSDLEGQIASLKDEVASLRRWTQDWPAEHERAAITALIKAEFDLYRATAEKGLADLAAEVHGISLKLEVSGDMETKIRLMVDLHERYTDQTRQLETVVTALSEQRAWTERQMRDEKKRQRQERLREARGARREAALRQTIASLQPVALLILGYISSSGLALVGALPRHISSVVDVVIFVSVLALLAWQGWGGATSALRKGRRNGTAPPRRRLTDGVDEAEEGEEDDDATT